MPLILSQTVKCNNCNEYISFPFRATIPEIHAELEREGWKVMPNDGRPDYRHFCPKCKEK